MNIFTSIKSALGSVNDQVAKQRATITTLRAELEAARETPLDLASATARLDAWLGSKVDRASMTAFLNADDKNPTPGIYPEDTNPMTLTLQLVGKAAVRQHLHGQLVSECKSRGPGMTAEVRRAKLESIEARLLEAEVQLEALLCEFERNGFSVQRDADADPRAVLGLV